MLSTDVDDAWALTAAISPRPTVRVAAVDASTGEILNAYPRRAQISAARPDAPWAVHLAERTRSAAGDLVDAYRLLCFDLDAGKGDPTAEAASLVEVLDRVGIEYLVVASGPTGGRHVWLALAQATDPALVRELAHLVRALCPSLDLSPLSNPATGCVRPPGAPHRLGGYARVFTGDTAVLSAASTTLTQLRQLVEAVSAMLTATSEGDIWREPTAAITARTPLPVDARGRLHLAGTRRPHLPAAAHEALTAAPGADASAQLWRVLIGAATARWRCVDVAALLEPASASPGLEHVRSRAQAPGRPRQPRSAREGAAVLARQWDKAVAWVAANPSTRTGEDATFDQRAGHIAALVEHVQNRAATMPGLWARRGGTARRRVLDALCTWHLRAVRDEHTGIEADVRRLALTCGIGRESARLALQWLTAHGWIRLVAAAEGTRAAVWALAAAPSATAAQLPVSLGQQPLVDLLSTDSGTTRSQAIPRPPHHPRSPLLGSLHRTRLLDRLHARLHAAVHDFFTPTSPALGPAAGDAYALLLEHGPLPHRELLRHLQHLPGNEHLLHVLVDHDLVHHTPQGWVGSPLEARDTAGANLRIPPVLADRAERYHLERQLWAWWCAEMTWMRAPQRIAAARRPSPEQQALLDVPVPTHPAYPRVRPGRRGDHRVARDHLAAAGIPTPGPRVRDRRAA